MNYHYYLRARYCLDAQSLSGHDLSMHGGHFDPETMTCRLRDELEADSVDPSEGRGGTGGNHSREYDEVVRRYKGTPLWMKAPNGRPTKLSERQWVQVRTPSFMKWFGDWEAADVQKFLESEPVGEAVGDEFAGMKREDVEREMEAYFKSIGGRVENPTIGPVNLTNRGINDTMRKGMGRLKYAAFKLVPDIIESGRVVRSENDWKGRGYSTYVIAAPISIGGLGHVAVVVVRCHQNGDRNFYLHEVSPLSVQKNKIAGLRSGLADNGEGVPSRDFGNILSKPLFSVNLSDVSKIVDENGEPRVVYHGTEERFTAFDPSRIGSHTDSGLWGRGFYFSSSEDEARSYDRANGTAGAYFLKMTSPCPAADVKKIAGEASVAAEEKCSDDMSPTEVKRLFDAEYHRSLDAYMSRFGFDGVVSDDARGSRPTEFVAMMPNQIKSATDNDGRFNPEDKDTTR